MTELIWIRKFAFIALFVLPTLTLAAVNAEDLALLEEAESARGDLGGRGIEWIVAASSEEQGETQSMKLRVITQSARVFAEVLEPEKTRGARYLIVDGKMWYHKPSLSRPVSVSRRQRVIGRAAVGDIAAMSFLSDYSAAKTETGTHEGESCVIYTLEQKSSKANYPLIRYWVSKERRVGVKAEFFSVSGSKLRTALMKYDHRLKVDGEERRFLSEMRVEEGLGSDKVTTLRYGDHLLQEFPEELFDYTKLTPDRPTAPVGRKK